nr:GDP-mannose 4,6-dehydratase [Neobacillus sp. Marseille-Q6967]
MKVLITGVTGLIGSHLAKHLIENTDFKVFGFKRWRSNEKNILRIKNQLNLIEGDISDYRSVMKSLQEIKPDFIYHLAAQSYPKESMEAPYFTYDANINGTINVLEAIKEMNINPRVHIACSSASYGNVDESRVPIKEDTPLLPLTHYGISKAVQEQLGYLYYKNYGIQTYMTRFFNQIGPGQNERSSVQSFCKQIALIEKGILPPILKVGNLEPKRDFTDIRDTVKALELLLLKGKPGEVYNIGSGNAISIRRVLEIILKKSACKVQVEVESSRLRIVDEPILQGDISKFQSDTGWTPTYDIEMTIESILDYWRNTVEIIKLKNLDV